MRYWVLVSMLCFGLVGCERAESSQTTPESSSKQTSDKKQTEQTSEPDEPSGSFSIDWSFIADKPVSVEDANAWARTRGRGDDELVVALTSKELGDECNLKEAVGTFGHDVEKGQYGLEFVSHDPMSDEKKQKYEGKPGTFDNGSFTIYYNSGSDEGTNSGFSADEDHHVTVEVDRVTEKFVVGTASAGDDNSEIEAEFTAPICTE